MQVNLLDMLDEPVDYSDKKVLIPLSAGINSAALLIVLAEFHPEERKPQEVHLFYAHLKEHSPDSLQFVHDLITYARTKFKFVTAEIQCRSVLDYFEQERTIPHPTISPCSKDLKIKPMERYRETHGIDVQMVGFTRKELRRWKRAQGYGAGDHYPILRMDDEDCFALVKQYLGWYPAIYDIKEHGKRVFTHNNCLPCKNMSIKQFKSVGKYYPEYAQAAQDTADRIPNAYWGREDVPDLFKCDVCQRM